MLISLLKPSEGARKANRFTVRASVNPGHTGSQLLCWRSSNSRTAKLSLLKNTLLPRRVPLHHLSLSLLSAPVMGLATGVVTESLVLTAFPTFGIRTGERERQAALLTAGVVDRRCHEQVHLRVHSA